MLKSIIEKFKYLFVKSNDEYEVPIEGRMNKVQIKRLYEFRRKYKTL